jgi:hypothetical protein
VTSIQEPANRNSASPGGAVWRARRLKKTVSRRIRRGTVGALAESEVDTTALYDFVSEVNNKGGIDVLADSLVESLAPRR